MNHLEVSGAVVLYIGRMVSKGWGSRISRHRHIKVVSLSALRTGRLYPQEYPGTHFERLSRPRAHGLLRCLGKNPQ
jgi:hypothetical protein